MEASNVRSTGQVGVITLPGHGLQIKDRAVARTFAYIIRNISG